MMRPTGSGGAAGRDWRRSGHGAAALFYVLLMQSSPGEGLPGRWAHRALTAPAGPVLVIRAMIPVPGSGASRDPVFADRVQSAVMACMLVQPSGPVHCTLRVPASSSAPDIPGAEDDPGMCSPGCPAADES